MLYITHGKRRHIQVTGRSCFIQLEVFVIKMAPPGEIVLLSAEETERDTYKYNINRTPVLSGWSLSAFLKLFESGLGGTVYATIGPSSGVTQVGFQTVLVLNAVA